MKNAERLAGGKPRLSNQYSMVVVAVLLALVLIATITLTIYNNRRLEAILEDSIKSELLATCAAARNDLDIELFLSINSEEDILNNRQNYEIVLNRLRQLQEDVEATYIYALKELNGKYYFVFDTDRTIVIPDVAIFIEYELSQIHIDAFNGIPSAGILNVTDEWGTYSTGAVPIYHEGKVIGIICADIEDSFVSRSRMTALIDGILLIVVVVAVLGFLFAFLISLQRRNQRMEEYLYRMSNFDSITGLQNRNYFFAYFSEWSKKHNPDDAAFALLFIDLDNFKNVNDQAGHDVGDDLLRLIANFFRTQVDANANDSCVESFIARIGGDEFLQVLPGISSGEELELKARSMLEGFMNNEELQPFIENFKIGLSIGGALFPSQTKDYDELIKFADIAMYKSKFGGKNNYTLYDCSMGEGTEDMVLVVRTKKKQACPIEASPAPPAPPAPTSETSSTART